MYLNPVFKKQYSFKMQLIKYDLSYMRYLLLGRECLPLRKDVPSSRLYILLETKLCFLTGLYNF